MYSIGETIATSVFMGLIIGIVMFILGLIFNFSNGFTFGFIIGTILFIVIFIIANHDTKKQNRDASSIIQKIWKESNHNLIDAVKDLTSKTGIDENDCKHMITDEIIKLNYVSQTLKDNNFDVEKTIDTVVEVYNYDRSEVVRKVNESNDIHNKHKQKVVENNIDKEKVIDIEQRKEVYDGSFACCLSCGNVLNPGDAFCSKCGVKKVNEAVKTKSTVKPYNIYKENGFEQKKEEYKYTPSPVTLSPKKQYKINKRNGIPSCPKCGSKSITNTNKKLSASRGAVGTAIGGAILNAPGAAVGAVIGGLTSKKIFNVCLNCGHRWKP